MNAPLEKKYIESTHKSQLRLTRVLSITRKHTSGAVKFWKQIGQIVRERLPIISSINDLWRGEGFVSGIPIIYQGKGWRGRVALVVLELIIGVIVLGYGDKILAEGKTNLYNLFIKFQLPSFVSWQVFSLMVLVCLTTLVYYVLVKPDDLQQALRTHKEERDM